MSETRTRLRKHIYENQGIHFNELVRESDLAPGQVQYHVRQLLRDGTLERGEYYGRTHYYPPTYDESERATIALFRRETAREIVLALLERGTAEPAALAADLDLARSTIEHHLSHLVSQDVVRKEYGEHNRVELSLVDPERTKTLLDVVTPTVSARLTDRFARFVDDVLDDVPDGS
ncbi:winged helix-turn-helix transcriptional regulator [Halovivax limisalsi]|uniref:winged helix-turn-helix transcriptional regulator n=1 Tax=Halovivax limisalsi TaxID=1453760 RepID=UPI001FFCF96A|nr:winged helix-turn-helix transcriptional regulator [Halovivax limisalsi]